MAEVKKIATRDSYGNALKELGELHEDLIVFDADLAGATKTGTFKKAFPGRSRRHGAGALCLQLCHVCRRTGL